MRIAVFAICFVLTANYTSAQQAGRKKRDVFPQYGNYERKGWIFSPLFTYTLRPIQNASENIPINDASYYDVEYRAVGRVGVGLEVGRFHVMDQSHLISFIDYTIGFKNLRGVEKFTATATDTNGNTGQSVSGEGVFGLNYVTASFNVNNNYQVDDNKFIMNTIGINADYLLGQNYNYDTRNIPIENSTPANFLVQAHYRLGFGIKLAPNLLMIPSVETPLLTLYQFDNFHSTIEMFNSRYRPLIGRVSFMMMDNKKDRQCPGKKSRKGGKPESLWSK